MKRERRRGRKKVHCPPKDEVTPQGKKAKTEADICTFFGRNASLDDLKDPRTRKGNLLQQAQH
eukprot:15343337-Ditylum_brightwellii.AAC.3